MKGREMKERKGAASIYIVIFTTTLLGVIALSFVRIMLAESLRTTNYSLSQSAYNSALAGIEDAKIVLLRNQNCVNYGTYSAGGRKIQNCQPYREAFGDSKSANKTAEDCDVVGKILHNQSESEIETVLQTSTEYNTDAIDQAYTCVKIATFTDDFIAVLKSDASTKIVPLRSENVTKQSSIDRIQIQWFDQDNYQAVKNEESTTGFYTNIDGGLRTGNLATNNPGYNTEGSFYSNSFGEKAIVPPPLQFTYVQTGTTFNVDNFYASAFGNFDGERTNRASILLRPTTSNPHNLILEGEGKNFSNHLPNNALSYSANKSFNTPIDIKCGYDPSDFGENWSNFACSADFYVPLPIEGSERNVETNYLVLSLPYAAPTTDVSVKMYDCGDNENSANVPLGECTIVQFANVQPMVDSTGRANDLFRRVESRIELADTSFPISNYALASTRDGYPGVQKNFYVTKSNCKYSSSWPSGDGKVKTYVNDKNEIKEGYLFEKDDVRPQDEKACYSASGANGEE